MHATGAVQGVVRRGQWCIRVLIEVVAVCLLSEYLCIPVFHHDKPEGLVASSPTGQEGQVGWWRACVQQFFFLFFFVFCFHFIFIAFPVPEYADDIIPSQKSCEAKLVKKLHVDLDRSSQSTGTVGRQE